jgi:hypothetical protein
MSWLKWILAIGFGGLHGIQVIPYGRDQPQTRDLATWRKVARP